MAYFLMIKILKIFCFVNLPYLAYFCIIHNNENNRLIDSE